MVRKKIDFISYESSKWYIKVWRWRWYIYMYLLYAKCYAKPELWIDYILDIFKLSQFEDDMFDEEREILQQKLKHIKRYVELYKMHKLSPQKRED